MNVLDSLGIDWKIFLAQLINFGIVLFVMWKWVYTPLLKMIDDRREKIEKGVEDARDAAQAKTAALRESDAAITAARREAQRIIELASDEAERLRTEGAVKARQEVERIVAEGRLKLADEKEKMVREARRDVAELVIAAAGKAVAETMTDKRDKAMLDAAVKKMTL